MGVALSCAGLAPDQCDAQIRSIVEAACRNADVPAYAWPRLVAAARHWLWHGAPTSARRWCDAMSVELAAARLVRDWFKERI